MVSLKDLNRQNSERRDLLYTKSRNAIYKSFDYFGNILMDSRTRLELSHIILDAQRDVDYWNIGVYDVDSVIYDFAEDAIKAFVELKTKEQVNYLYESFIFSANQYNFAKKLSEIAGKPYLWLIRAGNGKRWWYLTDISKINVDIRKIKGKEYAFFDKDKMLTLNDEQLKDWLIKNVL